MKIEGLFSFEPAGKDILPLGWVAIDYRWIKTKHARRKLHGKWVKISSDRKSIYRTLRFRPDLGRNRILVDWIGQIRLHDFDDEVYESQRLVIKPIPFWMVPVAATNHPDPSVKASALLGFLGLVLGLISLFVSFYPIFR